REQHDVGPELVARLADHRRDPAGVARDVPDREIELGHGDAQGVGHAGGSMRGEPRKHGPTRPTPAGIAAAAPPDRRPAPSPPHGLPPLLAGGWEGHLPEPTSHRLPPPPPSPASGGGSRAWRRWEPDQAPVGPNLAPVGAGSGSGNKGPRRPRPTACPSPRLRGEAGRGAPSGSIEMTCPHSAPRPFQPPQDRLAHR